MTVTSSSITGTTLAEIQTLFCIGRNYPYQIRGNCSIKLHFRTGIKSFGSEDQVYTHALRVDDVRHTALVWRQERRNKARASLVGSKIRRARKRYILEILGDETPCQIVARTTLNQPRMEVPLNQELKARVLISHVFSSYSYQSAPTRSVGVISNPP